MAEKPEVDSGKNEGVSSSGTIRMLLATMGDTTWRMFVPSVGFTLLGVALDRICDTKPWLMFIGIALGFVFAGLLVKLQLNKLKDSKSQRDTK